MLGPKGLTMGWGIGSMFLGERMRVSVFVSNSRALGRFLLVYFGGGSSSCCCDRGKTKSTPSPRPKTGV